MSLAIGILFALIAMLGWGFGDFFIQKSTRKIGIWTTVFIITSFGAIVLTPFALQNAASLFTFGRNIFLIGAIAYFIGAFLDLESLKEGKLDIVEPIWSLEIVSSSLLAFFILGETVSGTQMLFIALLILSLMFVSLRTFHLERKHLVEKGVYVALLAAITMGAANFFIGLGSREVDAITIKWGMDIFLAVGSGIFMLKNREFKGISKKIRKHKKEIICMSIFDNTAWLAFGFSMVFAPIAIAVALSESYIIIAVLLGYFINKEKLKKHQIFGLVLSIISAVYLATSL
ncbi:MAG: EamA family transporter [Nanoarchaeota archaeon]